MIKLVHHEMVINSKFLEVPRSYYQRHLNASRVKRIAAEFDERIANAPKVSYRDGHYYVFDGQHTIAARKLLNNNSDLNIVCKVYSGLTEQEEALLFAQQTGISAPLTAGAKLRAKIHGGDPEAIAFQSATQRAGFGLSFNQSHAKWKIACIATAFGEYPAAHILHSLLRERNQPEGHSGNHGSCGYFHHNGCIRRSNPREKERIHGLSAKRIACPVRHRFKITEMFLSAGQRSTSRL